MQPEAHMPPSHASTPPPLADEDTRLDPRFEVDRTRTFDRVMLAIIAVSLAACCLLLSAAQGAKAGMRPWSADSVLRVVVQLLNFDHQYPTYRGIGIKWLVQGLATAAALCAAVWIWTAKRQCDDDLREFNFAAAPPHTPDARPIFLNTLSLAGAAQVAMLLFAGWAMLSSQWSPWPEGSLGGGLRHLFMVLWAIALGHSLSRAAARQAAALLVLVLALTAALGLWYYYVRNPLLRLEFPIGNPIFFAACMLPAILLALAALANGVESLLSHRRSPTAAANRVPGPSPLRILLVMLAAGLALAVILWAFVLTDSRAPAAALLAGLAFGIAVRLVRVIPAHYRRIAVLAAIAISLALAFFVGLPWFRSQLDVTQGGRGSTLRLRLYTWRYAQEMFFSRPLTGHGQGGYLLGAQQMSRLPHEEGQLSDYERDPAAFPAELLGHAHNEWLEILADLGAVGFAFIATALGLTIWLACRAYLRAREPADRWCLLGLLAALIAIIIEECADVALRMPVLPLIFYTVVGLLWALASGIERPAKSPPRPLPRWARVGVLTLGGLAALAIVITVRQDWQGALADMRIADLTAKQQWDAAFARADAASRHRLVLEDCIVAAYHIVQLGHDAAAHRLSQLQSTLERLHAPGNTPGRTPANLQDLALADAEQFDRYGGVCVQAAEMLWRRIPAIDSVAGWAADICILRNQRDWLMQQFGIEVHSSNANWDQARAWLTAEFLRDRYNIEVALRLLQIVGDQSMPMQVDLLRIPLRSGPDPFATMSQVEAAVRLVMRNADAFVACMNALKTHADAALAEPDPDAWQDPFAPETLRLAALATAINLHFEPATELIRQAVDLYDRPKLRERYPTVASFARLELARYLLSAHPDQPGLAVQVCRKAIADWPDIGQRDESLKPFRRDLSLYLLAAGQYKQAAEVVQEQAGPLTPADVQRNFGYGLAELAERFFAFPPQLRPQVLNEWLRQSLEFAPDGPKARWLSARLALDTGRTADAINHLENLRANIRDSQQFADMLQNLAQNYPDNTQLSAYIEAHTPGTATQPDTSAPSSTQATEPSATQLRDKWPPKPRE